MTGDNQETYSFMTQTYSKADRQRLVYCASCNQSIGGASVDGQWPVWNELHLILECEFYEFKIVFTLIFSCEQRLNSIRCEINSSWVVMHGIVESFIKSKLEHGRKSKTYIELVRQCINHNLYFRFHVWFFFIYLLHDPFGGFDP